MNVIDSIVRPTLIINEDVCRANIRRMAGKARESAVEFRPHFKTHQSIEVGEWFKEEGVGSITVSSAEMALDFAAAGWRDITIAFPTNLREINVYKKLAEEISLNLLCDSEEVANTLSDQMEHLVGLFVEIDCGYGRSGVPPNHIDLIENILRISRESENVRFKGFLTHSGNTYQANNKDEIKSIFNDNLNQLNILKDRYINIFPGLIISIGDTPSCSIIEDFNGADEIRPGNFVFNDMMQYELGVCTIKDIGVSAACPVTGIYPERNEIVIYGGAIHLSKEFLDKDGKYFGLIVKYIGKGETELIPDTKLISLSQEHGIIKTSNEFLSSLRHGDIVGILPVHSCLTANLLKDSVLIS